MNETSSNAYANKVSPGLVLQQARVAHNLSQAEVAKRILVSKQTIIDIENDDYSKIAAPIYAKGYLTAYAKILQLNPDEILASFEALNVFVKNNPSESSASVASPISRQMEHGNFLRRISYLIFILLLLVIIFWAAHRTTVTKSATSIANASILEEPSQQTEKAQNDTATINSDEDTLQQNIALPQALSNETLSANSSKEANEQSDNESE